MRKALFLVSSFMAVSLLSTAVFASVNDDQVTSQKIKEADGTSGQNTNSGSGVKTNHIQAAAVTTSKIADGAISTLKLLNGAVTAQKLGIVCPDGQYLQFTAAGGWVCSVGTPGSTGPQGPTGAQGPAGPQGPAGAAPHYTNVVVVAKSGGDFSDPIAAINSITDASGTNPYLVKIMPGVYDLGAGTLVMKEYVDVEGAGENATVLTSSVSGGFFPVTATVSGANNSELRLLTVTNTALSGLGVAISNLNSSPKLTHLTAAVSGSPAYASAILNDHSSPTMNDVTASVTGATSDMYAVYNTESSPIMTNVSALASGESYSAFGVFSATNSSPVMTNVKAIAQGASNYNCGVSNSASSVVMRGVTATASGGGTWNKGIENDGCSVVMTDVVATAAGGTWCAAINNHVSTADMTNVTATASGAVGIAWGILVGYGTNKMTNVIATGSYGLRYQVDDSSQILVDRSTFEGGSLGIVSDGGTIKLGASKIVNGVGGNGTFICVNSYDGNFGPLGATCQ